MDLVAQARARMQLARIDSRQRRKLRLRAGITQRDLARQLKTTRGSLIRWENGELPSRPEQVIAYLDLLTQLQQLEREQEPEEEALVSA
jgi:transcriptional regulator with XRE-family HTH domain